MIRNLKTLGLALVAVFALSAVVASAASAQNGRLTSDGPVTLIVEQTGTFGSGANGLTAFGGKLECEKAFYTGHKYNVTPHELIPSGAETITITPHYGVCVFGGTIPMTVDMEGCDYVFHIEGTTGTDKYGVKETVICPEGKHITLTFFTTSTKHAENKPFCHETITENAAGYTGITATDTTNGTSDLTGTIKGISADKKSPTGSILCPEEITSEAELHIDLSIRGTQGGPGGKATAISLSHL